jgi:ferrochelatase
MDDGTTRCTRCAQCPAGCTYEAQLRETADLVAARLGLRAYTTGWQSAGRTADPWLGPPVEDVIRTAAKEGHSAVVVCSAGFVADHLEVLYDLDIEAKELAEEAGLRFVRTEMPNVDERFIGVLADVVRHHVAGEPAAP